MLERSIRLVILWFKLYTSDIELIELLYISTKTRLEILAVNKFQCFVLIKVASKNMIMIILENTYIEVTSG